MALSPRHRRFPSPVMSHPRSPSERSRSKGMEVRVAEAGRYILTSEDGKTIALTVEDYKERLAAKLIEEAPDLQAFRTRWVNPAQRRELMNHLADAGRSPRVVRELEGHGEFDLYDVLAELGYGLEPKSRQQRADSFTYKNRRWLSSIPDPAATAVLALAGQFAHAGTEELENSTIFQTPAVKQAGGIGALKALGSPAEVLRETKLRLFAA